MQIVSFEKAVDLGNLGNVMRVKDGYARNSLTPNKRARHTMDSATKEFEVRHAKLEKLATEKLAAAQTEGKKPNDPTLQLP